MRKETEAFNDAELFAILRVSYILSAVDGEISESEIVRFAKILEQILGEDNYAKRETLMFLEGIMDDAERLLKLRRFYHSSEVMVEAFMAKVEPSLNVLKKNPCAMRVGFAVWIGMGYADGVYSPIERMAIKAIAEFVKCGIDGVFLSEVETLVCKIIDCEIHVESQVEHEEVLLRILARMDMDKEKLRTLIFSH